MANMKLKTKLLIAFLAVGVIPACIIGLLALNKSGKSLEKQSYNNLIAMRDVKKGQVEQFFNERQGDITVLAETVGTVRKEAFSKLSGLREARKREVERYFESIENQILTFSQDQMIVDAMRDFKELFLNVRQENSLTDEDIKKMAEELKTYYTAQFDQTYQNQNGQTSNPMQYFNMLDQDSLALQYYYIQANPNPLGSKETMDRADDKSAYSQRHAQVHSIVRTFLQKFGYYDIFLVDSETGDIVYSVFKELDYSTSLIDGPYADTNFGRVFRQANQAGQKDAVMLVDYERYTPSYEAAASFIASPIFDGDKKIGVALFQMPIDRLNEIMGGRAGLGDTGETYLVGPDFLMRSDSYLDPKHHSVNASFQNPEKGKVRTEAAQKALQGQTGTDVIIDYNGNPVLSAYAPVHIGNMSWALMAEIDVAEAFCPVDENGGEFFAKYIEKYGYYDLFLMNPDGYCFYTVCHESDYQTNLLNGKYSDSNLGILMKNVLETKQFGLVDFAPYAPSNDDPAAFIAQPLVYDGDVEVVVALQLSIEAINKIMQQRAGMGETGETYLVGQDKLMRSDSYLDPTAHSVKASFAGNVAANGVDTDASNEALSGKTDAKIVIDYNGNSVLSAYTPVKVGNTSWALLAEIDESEALQARNAIVWMISITMGVSVVTILTLAMLITRSITLPINRIIAGLTQGAEQVSSASTQVASASQSLAEGATEQAAGLEETSSSLEQMSSMTKQNADNAGHANTLVNEARSTAQNGSDAMSRMSGAINDIQKSSSETAKIIKVIDEIAFQTNLLALNAAVEAARAGEAGKGFAVVAEEVRNLAMRSAEAAGETSNLIEESVKNSQNGVAISAEVAKVLEEIVTTVSKTTDLVGEIAAASQEQAQGIDQVNTAVAQMDKVTQQNAANAEESASASEQLTAQARQMNDIVGDLTALVRGVQNIGSASMATTSRHMRHQSAVGDDLFHQIADLDRTVTSQTEQQAAQTIPFDSDGDFSDFDM